MLFILKWSADKSCFSEQLWNAIVSAFSRLNIISTNKSSYFIHKCIIIDWANCKYLWYLNNNQHRTHLPQIKLVDVLIFSSSSFHFRIHPFFIFFSCDNNNRPLGKLITMKATEFLRLSCWKITQLT